MYYKIELYTKNLNNFSNNFIPATILWKASSSNGGGKSAKNV